jgi:hypothetical protein
MGVADTIGLIGGLAGLLALGIEGYGLWKRRQPQLTLFTPYFITGDTEDKRRVLFVLVRISNSSERVANLYLETTSAEILFKGRWYPVTIPSFPKDAPMNFDLDNEVQWHAGLKSFEFFNKFDEAVISLDYPYSRYLAFHSHQREAINNPERLRLILRDCNLNKYVVESEILRNDPEHLTI